MTEQTSMFERTGERERPIVPQRVQAGIFDGDASEARKQHGKAAAVPPRLDALQLARGIAHRLCLLHGSTHADAVGAVLLDRHGIATLGPAAGSLFNTPDFVWTGEFVKSERKTNHSRLLRVWRLR